MHIPAPRHYAYKLRRRVYYCKCKIFIATQNPQATFDGAQRAMFATQIARRRDPTFPA
jgi:hypothetical protein